MEVDPSVPENITWRKARACEGGACVMVARQGESVLIRSNADPGSPISVFTREEWSAFIDGIKLGDFDDIARS